MGPRVKIGSQSLVTTYFSGTYISIICSPKHLKLTSPLKISHHKKKGSLQPLNFQNRAVSFREGNTGGVARQFFGGQIFIWWKLLMSSHLVGDLAMSFSKRVCVWDKIQTTQWWLSGFPFPWDREIDPPHHNGSAYPSTLPTVDGSEIPNNQPGMYEKTM